MKKQFYRLYLLLLLSAGVIIWSLSEIYTQITSVEPKYYITAEQLFSKHTNLSPRFQFVVPESIALTDELEAELTNGEIIAYQSEEGIYYLQKDKAGNLTQFGPVDPVESTVEEVYYLIIFYSLLALLVLILTRPVFRDLAKLQKAAAQFSEDQNTFSPMVSKRSSIYPLAHTLSTMSRQINETIEMHSDISKIISHEIRTPLSRLKFSLEKLHTTQDPNAVDRMHDDLEEIEQMLDDYLSFSKVESFFQYQTLEQVKTELLTTPLKQTYKQYNPDIKLTIESNVDLASFDLQSMKHACQNLLNNAFRFAETKIAFSFIEDSHNYQIIIEDDGPGFTNTQNITSAFVRDNQSKNNSGYGLGLYIVKKLMNKHNGRIEIGRSERLGGAEVKLIWPKY